MSIHPTLDDVRSKKDPAPNWRWVVRMPTDFKTTTGGSTPYTQGGAYGGLLSKSALPFIIAEQVDFQTHSIDSDARFGGGIRTNYPRFLSMTSLSLTLMEDYKYTTIRYLKAWQRAVVDDDHNYGLPINYKRDIKLYAFDIINNNQPVFVGTFRDCWPTNASGMSFSYDNSGHVTVAAEFACDKDAVDA